MYFFFFFFTTRIQYINNTPAISDKISTYTDKMYSFNNTNVISEHLNTYTLLNVFNLTKACILLIRYFFFTPFPLNTRTHTMNANYYCYFSLNIYEFSSLCSRNVHVNCKFNQQVWLFVTVYWTRLYTILFSDSRVLWVRHYITFVSCKRCAALCGSSSGIICTA